MQQVDAVSDTGRTRSFEDVYRRHYAAVLAYAVRRIADRETAREVAADVFRIAWTGFDPAAEPSRAWLLRVAHNRIGDAYRSRDRDRRLFDALAVEQPAGDGVDVERVRSALDRLPPSAREVLLLTYWDGLSAAEAGRVLGVTPAAVWVRLHRARRAFERLWEEES